MNFVKTLHQHIGAYRIESEAVEEYFLNRNICATDVIRFCAPILTDPRHKLYRAVLIMFCDIPDIRGLSCSLSSGWKVDSFEICREQKILERIISQLSHPSTQVLMLCLLSINMFLMGAIDHEKSSNGFPTFFALGKPEILTILKAKSKIRSVRIKKSRSRSIRAITTKILIQLANCEGARLH